MKKLYLILFLILINVSLLYVKIYSNKLKNINLKLKDNEIAIIILFLEDSNSILIKSLDIHLLYTFDYRTEKNLESNISLFTNHIDYVFMKEEYTLSYPNKIHLDGLTVIQDIQIEPNKIHCNNYTFCIDMVDNCDFIYLTEEKEVNNQKSTIFYADSLPKSYIESFHDDWIDVYKVTKDNYTILLLSDDYEVIQLEH